MKLGVLVAAGIAAVLGVAKAADMADNDPNLWLADIHGAKAVAWAKEQTDHSNQILKADPNYQKTYDSLIKDLNTNDRIPLGALDHGDVYNFWQDGTHVRGIWRKTTVADYRKPDPKWDVIIDVDKLDADEKQPYVWQGADCAPGGATCLVQLSPGGGDAAIVREFDMKTRTFMKDGFSLSLSKLRATYVDADTVLFTTDFGPGTMNKSSYPRILKLWKRGEKISDAKTVYEGTVDDVQLNPVVFHGPYGTIAMIDRGLTFFTSEFYYLLPDGKTIKLPIPAGAQIQGVTQGNLIFTLRDAWSPSPGAKEVPQGSLVAMRLQQKCRNPAQPAAAGEYCTESGPYVTLYTPDEHSAIDSVSAGRDAVYASINHDVTGSVHAFKPNADGTWSDVKLALPGGGSTTVVSANDWGPEAYFTYESFLVPPTLYATDGAGSVAIKSQKPLFDASNLVSEQFWATSNDGTKVPYFLIRPKKAKGPLPTILYSYGGFELSLNPWYWNDGHRPLYAGNAWLTRGGAIVVANIRGGGEFGPRWHQAALKENRQKAFDDFASIGKDVEARGFTDAAHLGIVGASNGGVLTTVTMTQHPELLRAVVSQRPLVDMLRYTQYGAGASWVDEYGDPAKPEERAYIEKYSAYQNVKPDVKYPSILFITETSDDRVTPIWARMMAAKMESQGHDVLFNESTEGGHGPGATNAAQAEMWALSYTYLGKELGLWE